MDFLSALIVAALLFGAYAIVSLSFSMRFGMAVAAGLILVGGYVEEGYTAAQLAAREAELRKQQVAKEAREQADKRRQQEMERVRRREIESQLPNSFIIGKINVPGPGNIYLPAQKACLVDDIGVRQNRQVVRTIDVNNKRVHYANPNRYSYPSVNVMFYDAVDGNCRSSLSWILNSGLISNSVFTNQRTWPNIVRVLARGAAPSTERWQTDGGSRTSSTSGARTGGGTTTTSSRGTPNRSDRFAGTYEFQRASVPSGNQGGRLRLNAKRKCFAFLPHGEDGSAGVVQVATGGDFVVATNSVRWSPKRIRVFWFDDYGQGCQSSYRQILTARAVGFLNQYQNDVAAGRADPPLIATMQAGQADNNQQPLGQLGQELEKAGERLEEGVEKLGREIGEAFENIFKRK